MEISKLSIYTDCSLWQL